MSYAYGAEGVQNPLNVLYTKLFAHDLWDYVSHFDV